jgi:hypothetical protein
MFIEASPKLVTSSGGAIYPREFCWSNIALHTERRKNSCLVSINISSLRDGEPPLRSRDFLFPIVLAWVTMPGRGKALASHPEFFPTTGDS